MKRSALILALLALSVTAFGQVRFPGIIFTGSKTISGDSAKFATTGGLITFATPGWGGGSMVYDTAWFELGELPTYFGFWYKVGSDVMDPVFATFKQDTWIYLPVTGQPPPRFPQLMWGSGGGIEENLPGSIIGNNLTVTPNPFSGRTRLSVKLARPGRALVELYDATGRIVRSLADAELEPGEYHWTWDGTDDNGRQLTTGIYLARLVTGDQTAVRKLVLSD